MPTNSPTSPIGNHFPKQICGIGRDRKSEWVLMGQSRDGPRNVDKSSSDGDDATVFYPSDRANFMMGRLLDARLLSRLIKDTFESISDLEPTVLCC